MLGTSNLCTHSDVHAGFSNLGTQDAKMLRLLRKPWDSSQQTKRNWTSSCALCSPEASVLASSGQCPLVALDNDLLGFPPLSIFALTKVFPPPNQARKLESTRPYYSYPRNLTAQSKEHPHRFSCFLYMQEDERELLSVFWALCHLRGNAQHSAPHKGCNSACEG